MHLPKTGKLKIPKIIHQTWKDDRIPIKYAPWITSWTSKHPDWEYWFWTDADARAFMVDLYPSYLELYDNYPIDIERVDIVRYFILHQFGGVYADLDMESINSLEPLFYKYPCVLSQEPRAHPILDTNTDALVCNAFLACSPQHDFFTKLIKNTKLFSQLHSAMDRSGPHYVNINYQMYQSEHKNGGDENFVLLSHPEYFMMAVSPAKIPLFQRKCREGALSRKQEEVCAQYRKVGFKNLQSRWAFTVHHWQHVWKPWNLFKAQSQRHINIADIVPHVKRYISKTIT